MYYLTDNFLPIYYKSIIKYNKETKKIYRATVHDNSGPLDVELNLKVLWTFNQNYEQNLRSLNAISL